MNFEAKGGLADGSAELRAHRDAWEAENESGILKDLQEVFEKPGGKKITRAEFLELAKKVQESKLTKDQLKELIARTRNPETGKLKLEAAKQNADKQEMPPAPAAKVRKIDYPKARQQNVVYQKMRAWDPVTFVKQPGIKVDSDEFANAVYDMQEALRIKADGILGDDTLVAFYDKNKKKPDLQYEEANKAIEQKRAAEAERAAKAKAAKDKAAADKGVADKGGVAPAPLPASVKVLNANGRQVASHSAGHQHPDHELLELRDTNGPAPRLPDEVDAAVHLAGHLRQQEARVPDRIRRGQGDPPVEDGRLRL
jgi:hypothetical protein